ncbi:MAG: type II secretion system F family protein [Actinomycetia bacterium]|nr:type II secretion system F family protein [Actinomycetes bacterium]
MAGRLGVGQPSRLRSRLGAALPSRLVDRLGTAPPYRLVDHLGTTLPSRRGTSRAARPGARTRAGARPPSATLSALAAAGAAVTPLALFGPLAGAAVGALVAPATWFAVRRFQARGPSPPGAKDQRALPLVLDLLAAALAAGQPLPAALTAAAPAAGDQLGKQLTQVAGLLRLGAEPATAWRALAADPALAPVARTACRSAESGVRLADGFARLAGELRADAVTGARARAQRAGIWSVAPLGLCFLPAFICLGVAPTVVGVARDAFVGLLP